MSVLPVAGAWHPITLRPTRLSISAAIGSTTVDAENGYGVRQGAMTGERIVSPTWSGRRKWQDVPWTPKPWTPALASTPAVVRKYFFCYGTDTDHRQTLASSVV